MPWLLWKDIEVGPYSWLCSRYENPKFVSTWPQTKETFLLTSKPQTQTGRREASRIYDEINRGEDEGTGPGKEAKEDKGNKLKKDMSVGIKKEINTKDNNSNNNNNNKINKFWYIL